LGVVTKKKNDILVGATALCWAIGRYRNDLIFDSVTHAFFYADCFEGNILVAVLDIAAA
jgi:hypothetical protein